MPFQNAAFSLQALLRKEGFKSDIFAEQVDSEYFGHACI